MVGESAVAFKAAWIVAVSFIVTLAAILLAPLFERGFSCDSDAVTNTLKQIAVEKLNAIGGTQLIRKGGSSADHQRITEAALKGSVSELPMTIGAIRDRGAIGKGISCAGIIYMSPKAGDGPEFAAIYTVEPTSDGKTIVTARFMPD